MPAFATFGRFGEFWGGRALKRPVRANNTFHIVYTGSIYGAQLDAVRRLVHVVNQESERSGDAQVRIRLTLYTSATAGAIGTNGSGWQERSPR